MARSRTLLCAAVMVDGVDGVGDALAEASLARDRGADLVEFRVDGVRAGGVGGVDGAVVSACERLCAESVLPCIVTCRPVWEGGVYEGPEGERAGLFEALLRCATPPRYVDIEKRAWEGVDGFRERVGSALGSAGLILSSHDFEGRPASLFRLLGGLRSHGQAAVLKVAFRARSVRDNVEVLDVLRERDRPTIALAMGEAGVLSRVCAAKFGGYLTFASVDAGGGTAAGQPTVEEMVGLYRFGSVGSSTRVFGVIGDPVSHSASPAVHNDAFGRAGFDGVYVPLPVAAGWESFKASVLELMGVGDLHFGGASVTAPHKEHLVALAREEGWAVDGVGDACGAANTLVVGEEGVRVMNTDAGAIVGALRERLGRSDLGGVRVAVVGAGGVARAAAAGLALAGASVEVFGRTRSKVDGLVRDLGGLGGGGAVAAGSWEGLSGARAEAVVHCTPVGMRGGGEAGGMAFDPAALGAMVFETVYAPVRTPLVEAAEAAGLGVIDGLEMFARQASAQSVAWTGAGADVSRMRRVAGDWLGE